MDHNQDTTTVIEEALVVIPLIILVIVLLWVWRKRNYLKKCLFPETPRRTTRDGQTNMPYVAANSPQQGYDYAAGSNVYFVPESMDHSVMSNNESNQDAEYNHLILRLSPMSGACDTTASEAKSKEQADCSPADACYDPLKQPTATENISNTYDITEK